PARHRHQEDGHRETPGHRVRTRLLLAGHPRTGPVRKEEPPAQAGPRTVEPRRTRRDTRAESMPAHRQRHHEDRLKNRNRTRALLHPGKPETPKVRGVGLYAELEPVVERV